MLRQTSQIILLLILLTLVSCASAPGFEKNISAISILPISADANLNVSHVGSLGQNGTYLQRITTTINSKQHSEKHSFSVYLTLDNNKLDAIAFNDISGRLYQLTWRANHLEWTRSKYIPATLKPENIMADFLLTHLNRAQLRKSLVGAKVHEETSQHGKIRLIENQSGTLRKIVYANHLSYGWKNITIINPQLGYTLDIQTVPQ